MKKCSRLVTSVTKSIKIKQTYVEYVIVKVCEVSRSWSRLIVFRKMNLDTCEFKEQIRILKCWSGIFKV